MAATRSSSNASLLNGGPTDLHMGGHTTVGGQLDLSMSGSAAAAAAAAASRDTNGYHQNNNELKIGALRWVHFE